MAGSFIYDGIRTPFGKFGKSLAGIRPDDLASHVIREVVDRQPGLETHRIDEVILGNANGAGEDNRNVARMSALLAGLPTSVPGVTVNRLCGSGLEAAIQASRAVEIGDADLVVAGGVESMSRAPWILAKPERAFPAGPETLHSSTLGWRMVNPRMNQAWTISNGETAENLADKFDISRTEQDQFAVSSHRLAAKAWSEGIYDDEVVPHPDSQLLTDEGVRPTTSGGPWPVWLRHSVTAVQSLQAIHLRSMTGQQPCLSAGRAPWKRSPWHASFHAGWPAMIQTSSALRPWRPPTGLWPGQGRPGMTWMLWS
jgi:acetyl-CoA acetyltransferase family protein